MRWIPLTYKIPIITIFFGDLATIKTIKRMKEESMIHYNISSIMRNEREQIRNYKQILFGDVPYKMKVHISLYIGADIVPYKLH